MTNLAQRLKASRTQRGWSQEDLAKRLRIRQSFIGALESGAQKSSKYLPDIAHELVLCLLLATTKLGDWISGLK